MTNPGPPKKEISIEAKLLSVSEGLSSAAQELADMVASLQSSFKIDPGRNYNYTKPTEEK